MREHEVPTHVQAEDKVLLGFTFQQIVGVMAVAALAYGVYRYVPVPSSEVRIGLAVLLGLVGLAAILGRAGGRRLPLAAADLLQYRLGGRCYAGTPAELVRGAPPAPANESPGLIQHMAEKTRHRIRRLHRKPQSRERRHGRRPLRPGRWFGNRRKPRDRGNENGGHAAMRRVALIGALALAALAVLAASGEPTPFPAPVPTAEPTPGPGTPYPQTSPERWRNEIEFDAPDPVPGRRLFIERLAVFEDRATVTLRAATQVDLNVQAFGGPGGRELHFYSGARVGAGETIFYTLPLSGDAPSLTFAWVDASGQAGAVSLRGDQLPYPLPAVEGELCEVKVTSVHLSPGSISGRVDANECIERVEHPIDLVVVTGEEHIAGAMMMKTRVTEVYGSVTVSSGESTTTAALQEPGGAAFLLPVPPGKAVHELTFEFALEGYLRGKSVPLVVITLIPEREEIRLVPVQVLRPGVSKTVRETVTVRNKDGTTSSHEISARLTVPSEIITVVPSVLIKHEEYIAADVRPRGSVGGSKEESLELSLTIGADTPYRPFTFPPVEEEPPPPVQTPLTELEAGGLFGILGWVWPW